eukprot:GFUD01002194.1.p1 GENE.GFUD01002194.1~~GFUD01002194.1.p1  ORF type:complete len:211 (+),score=6.96 GFUD01002194.1:104-736(+)
MGHIEIMDFCCRVVAFPIISLIGLIGNIAMIIKYAKKINKRIMDHLILMICIFNLLTLLMYSNHVLVSKLLNTIDSEYSEISTFLSPYSVALTSMGIYGSSYGTLCLSLERYLLLKNIRLHKKLTALKMILPVVLLAIITNIHRLAMLTTTCIEQEERKESLLCEEGKKTGFNNGIWLHGKFNFCIFYQHFANHFYDVFQFRQLQVIVVI